MVEVLNAEEVLMRFSEAVLGEDYFRDRAELSMAGVLVTGRAAGREAGVRVREPEGRMVVRVFVPGSSALSQSFDFPADMATEENLDGYIQQALDSHAQW